MGGSWGAFGILLNFPWALHWWKPFWVCGLFLPMHTQAQQRQTQTGSPCSFNELNQGQSQEVSDIDLCQSLAQEAPEPTHPVASFRQHQSRVQLVSKVAHPKGELRRLLTLLRRIHCVVSACRAASTLWLGSVLSQPA